MKHSIIKPLLLLTTFVALITSCSKHEKNQFDNNTLSNTYLIADTIIYPVRIKNLDSTDTWADERLQHLKHQKLVDGIFQSVYSGKSTAYTYMSNKPLTINQLKELEASETFSRNRVAELQFEEAWWFNPDQSIFKKQVLSVLIAYEVYNEDGTLRGLKAAFYIKTNL
jgi:hypothetical protein